MSEVTVIGLNIAKIMFHAHGDAFTSPSRRQEPASLGCPTAISPWPARCSEVRRLLDVTVCLSHLAALSVAYGTGMRIAEVVSLRVGDVGSARMLLRVERDKGGHDRNAMLSVALLAFAREWRVVEHRQGLLFPAQRRDRQIPSRQFHRILEGRAKL